jgi:hypothetical protein
MQMGGDRADGSCTTWPAGTGAHALGREARPMAGGACCPCEGGRRDDEAVALTGSGGVAAGIVAHTTERPRCSELREELELGVERDAWAASSGARERRDRGRPHRRQLHGDA